MWICLKVKREAENLKEEFSRTALIIGEKAMERLAAARVAIFGIGGVGGYVCEALVRSGVGAFELIDNDTVSLSNLNRQIIATRDTLGQPKVEVMRRRMLSINPEAEIKCRQCFFLPENAEEFDFSHYDYVVDAVDTVTAKLQIILQAKEAGVRVISSMGAGNKLDGSAFKVADIYETKVCPLAKVMRRELKKRGVKELKVVYSEEETITPVGGFTDTEGAAESPGDAGAASEKGGEAELPRGKRSIPGSVAFVPSVAGLIIAGEVVRDLADVS